MDVFEQILWDIITRLRDTEEAILSLRSKGVIIKEMVNVLKKLAYKEKNIVRRVGDIMGGKPHKLEWLERFDAAVAEGKAEGGDIRDEERITDMLRRGKTVEAIVDFCGYPEDLVKKIEKNLLVTA